ncbi:MAG: WG repeat-containing protein [Planctomycetota bacterium]
MILAARPFSEGLAPAFNGVAWGYITPDGTYAIDPRFDDAWPHERGLASVTVDGQRRYIDASGRTVWPRPSSLSSPR